MKHFIITIAILITSIALLILYKYLSMPISGSGSLNLNFQDSNYILNIVSSKNYSVIVVSDINQAQDVHIKQSFTNGFINLPIKDSLAIDYKGSETKAQWYNVYFISQSGNIKSATYKEIFGSEVELMKIKILSYDDLPTDKIKDKIKAYMESNPTVIE